MTGPAKGGTEVTFGEYGIQALEPGWITARQIEAARIAMTRLLAEEEEIERRTHEHHETPHFRPGDE
jgi:ribosomal protein L16/L10AE